MIRRLIGDLSLIVSCRAPRSQTLNRVYPPSSDPRLPAGQWDQAALNPPRLRGFSPVCVVSDLLVLTYAQNKERKFLKN